MAAIGFAIVAGLLGALAQQSAIVLSILAAVAAVLGPLIYEALKRRQEHEQEREREREREQQERERARQERERAEKLKAEKERAVEENFRRGCDAVNAAEAEHWWRKAAKAGHKEAAFQLGLLLKDRKPAQAERLWRPLAEAGHAEAAFRLGNLLMSRDWDEGMSWWRRAAEAGSRDAAYNLGIHLRTWRDQYPSSTAEPWLRQAAEAGHKDAFMSLASLLEAQGRVEEAKRWQQRWLQAHESEDQE